jgi:predicted NAD-dependent protein-ADP-ribosyltransferase YbiA (DUF1768 family)
MEEPYDQKTTEQIRAFYKQRSRRPAQFKIGEDGSLNTYSKEGVLESTVSLKTFRPITTEERTEMDTERLTKLSALDLLYEQERKKLHDAYLNYKITGEVLPVVQANQNVLTAELRRVDARSAVRGVKTIPIPTTNQILFDEPYEQRKLFGTHNLLGKDDMISEGIFVLERRPFTSTHFYGRYEKAGTPLPAPVLQEGSVAGAALLSTGVTARIFFSAEDPQNGYLSPMWPVDFVYKETRYSSAFQAYEAERMAEKGQKEVRDKILKTRSARTIAVHTRKVTEPASNPQALWLPILTAVYNQHPELVEKLVSTGQDTLVYADPAVGGGGVGVGSDSKKILDPANWRSPNVVGKVLEGLRASMREKAPAAEPPPPEAKESVITVEEQEKAKTGAIIRAVTGKIKVRK